MTSESLVKTKYGPRVWGSFPSVASFAATTRIGPPQTSLCWLFYHSIASVAGRQARASSEPSRALLPCRCGGMDQPHPALPFPSATHLSSVEAGLVVSCLGTSFLRRHRTAVGVSGGLPPCLQPNAPQCFRQSEMSSS